MDVLTKEQRKKCMTHIRSQDTGIELSLRRALWQRGYRYRKNVRSLPGTPDIVLTKYRIAIFCDSEFWHGKDWEVLKPRLMRGSHADFWIRKIERNRERDVEVDKKLLLLDWTVIRFWGEEILADPDRCVGVIEEILFEKGIREYEEGYLSSDMEEAD